MDDISKEWIDSLNYRIAGAVIIVMIAFAFTEKLALAVPIGATCLVANMSLTPVL